MAHRLELYRRTAERIDASTDPSIVHGRAGLGPFLGEAAGPPVSGQAAGPPVSGKASGSAFGAGWDVEVSRSGFQLGGEVASSAR